MKAKVIIIGIAEKPITIKTFCRAFKFGFTINGSIEKRKRK
jgi:hypothetical protein